MFKKVLLLEVHFVRKFLKKDAVQSIWRQILLNLL